MRVLKLNDSLTGSYVCIYCIIFVCVLKSPIFSPGSSSLRAPKNGNQECEPVDKDMSEFCSSKSNKIRRVVKCISDKYEVWTGV